MTNTDFKNLFKILSMVDFSFHQGGKVITFNFFEKNFKLLNYKQ